MFRDITYTVPDRAHKGEKLQILKGVTGACKAGRVLAIMGASGAGRVLAAAWQIQWRELLCTLLLRPPELCHPSCTLPANTA